MIFYFDKMNESQLDFERQDSDELGFRNAVQTKKKTNLRVIFRTKTEKVRKKGRIKSYHKVCTLNICFDRPSLWEGLNTRYKKIYLKESTL